MKNNIKLTKESISHFIEVDELIYKRSLTLIPEKDPNGTSCVPRVDRTEIDTVAEMVDIYWYVTGYRGYTNKGKVRSTLSQFLAS